MHEFDTTLNFHVDKKKKSDVFVHVFIELVKVHLLVKRWEKLGFSVLPKDTSARGQSEQRFQPPTLDAPADSRAYFGSGSAVGKPGTFG